MIVIGTAGTKEGMDLVKSQGADKVYNHKEKDYMTMLGKENKFDVIIEMLSNVNLQNDLTLMASKGTTVVRNLHFFSSLVEK